jgi:hypothetical protein
MENYLRLKKKDKKQVDQSLLFAKIMNKHNTTADKIKKEELTKKELKIVTSFILKNGEHYKRYYPNLF